MYSLCEIESNYVSTSAIRANSIRIPGFLWDLTAEQESPPGASEQN